MQWTKIMKTGIMPALCAFLWGCASQQDVRILDREVNRLQSQVNLLQKENQSQKEARNRESTALRSEWKNDLTTEIKKLQADLFFRIEKNESEIRILTTGLDEYKDFAKRPSKDVERVREDLILRTRVLEERGKVLEEKGRAQEDRARVLEEKIRTLEERLRGTEGKIDSVAKKQVESEKLIIPPKEVAPEVKVPATGMGEIYKDAYETYQKGDPEGARRKFEAFLKQYPNTDLSDNAQFWIGETYYVKKDYEKAILEYEKVIVKYPEGDKVPAALLKQGLAFQELGDRANARNLFRRVVDRYPQSEQAEIAKKRLDLIK
jgi:tol-pal system protein YbgF